MGLTGLDHVNLKVRDLEASRRFYEMLGMKVTGHRDGMLFMAINDHHHHLALYEMGKDAQKPPRGSVGLGHVGFSVATEEELKQFHKRFTDAGLPIEATLDHLVSKTVYVRDPDGNMVEIAYNVPRDQWEHLDNPLEKDLPYDVFGGR